MKKINLVAALFLAASQWSFGQFTQLADINPGSSASSIVQEKGSMAQLGSTLFFSAVNAQNGAELWKTDGTTAGTQLVKDINPGTNGSRPDHFYVVGNLLLFTADDGTAGRELWKTDGSAAGTEMLAELRPGAASAFEDWFLELGARDFQVFKNELFFRAYTDSDGLELYKSDGTTAGTGLLKSIGFASNDGCQGDFEELSGELFFVGFTTLDGGQIWKTDGTAAGTVQITTTLNETPTDLKRLGNLLLFVEDDGTSGPELWKLDGTAAGTALLKNTDSAAGSGGLSHSIDAPEERFFIANSKAWFSVIDASGDSQLWVSDGTPTGSKKLKSVATPGFSTQPASHFIQLGTQVLFLAQELGDFLWKSNGIAAGTQMVSGFTGVFPFGPPAFPLLHAHDSKGWFGSETSSFNILYQTDGTIAGTNIVSSPNLGSFLDPQRFFSFGNALVFWAAADNNSSNLEPFIFRPVLNISGTTTAVKCPGGNDGSILVQPSGDAPFTAEWSSPLATGLNPTGLPVNLYSVTITDASGATGSASFQITSPSVIQISTTTTPQIDATANGTATVNPTGGTPPFQFLWNSAPPQTSQTATGLLSGPYSCLVTDANGCTKTVSTSVDFMVGTIDLEGENGLRLVPNPASKSVSIFLENQPDRVLECRLFDSTGKLIRVFENASRNEMQLDGLPDGLLVMQVLMENRGWRAVRFQKMD